MLKHYKMPFIALALCVTATFTLAEDAKPAPKPTKTAPGSAKAGQETFNSICAQCHSIQPDQVKFGPSLYGELKKPHPKKTDAEVHQIIKEGKGKMPPLGSKLSDQEIANVIAYLHTL
jgi:mono/diheme cytochrome c family protein